VFRSSAFFGPSLYLTGTQSISFTKACNGKILDRKLQETLFSGSHIVSYSTDGQMWWCTNQLRRDLSMYIFQLWNYIQDFDRIWYMRVILKIVRQIYWFESAHVTVTIPEFCIRLPQLWVKAVKLNRSVASHFESLVVLKWNDRRDGFVMSSFHDMEEEFSLWQFVIHTSVTPSKTKKFSP
jgi:hypothetical protein